MAHELEYIVKDALMMCDRSAPLGFFCPTYSMTAKVNGCLVTTEWQKTYKVERKLIQ